MELLEATFKCELVEGIKTQDTFMLQLQPIKKIKQIKCHEDEEGRRIESQ